jgi:uncharacterized protein (TIGR02231 family)
VPSFNSLICSVLLGVCSSALATEAPIRAVVLYPGTAMIQRELSVAPGSRHIELEGLPTDFTIESLRVDGSEGVHLGQLTLKDAASLQHPDPREAGLEDRIQALEDKKSLLDIDAQAAESVKDLLGRLTLAADKGGGVSVVDGRNLAGVLEQVRKSSTDSLATIQSVALQKRELDRQIDVAGKDLDQLRSGRSGRRLLSFDVVAERDGKVLIRYPQRGAGWRPAYRAELDSASGRVTLQRQAIVRQRTGEDWTGVNLQLSTGRPQLEPSGPEAQPWSLRLQPEYNSMASQMRAAAPSAPAPPSPPPAGMIVASAMEPEIEEFQAPFTTEFSVPLPVSLPSDGSEVTLELGGKQLDTTLRLRAVPRLDPVAYVEAEAQRPEGDWLPGTVQLVRDGDFVGQSFWQPQSGEKFLLPFGRDDLVRVTYRRKQDQTGTAGLLGHRSSREIVEVYTITSGHRSAMKLLVLDPTPVSADDQVKVEKDFSPVPDSSDWDSRNGVVAWQPTLGPGETMTLQTHYVLSFPQGRTVLGLP